MSGGEFFFELTDGAVLVVQERRNGDAIDAKVGDLSDMGAGSRATMGHHRNANGGGEALDELHVEAFFGAFAVHRGQQQFARAEIDRTPRPVVGI